MSSELNLNAAQSVTSSYSRQMCAVLTLFATDEVLYAAVMPFIDFEHESINWDRINSLHLHKGHRAIRDWAFALWRDEIASESNPFESALEADSEVLRAMLRALAIRWGLATK